MDNKVQFITPFSVEARDGGGYVTRAFLKAVAGNSRITFYKRGDSIFSKIISQFIGFLRFPFLHPIFTRYIVFDVARSNVIANFSQCFANVLLHKEATLVCHDLQYHRDFFFKRWVVWSERFLISKAAKVYVLSERDRNILIQHYGIDHFVVVNVASLVFPPAKAISVKLPKRKKILFIGSLDRIENLEGLNWFAVNVLANSEHHVDVIGGGPEAIKCSRINYLGFVDDFDSLLLEYDLSIAPMFTPQGVKIKVVEAMAIGLPVLGTTSAFSGLDNVPSRFVSDDPSYWREVLDSECVYRLSVE
jgi:glycosyltransferase involved in cell wall biosynthesis